MDYSITLPDGTSLDGTHPIVVIGPNGSGKTRQARNMKASVSMSFVNALRNTRVAPELPAMGFETARSQYASQLSQARSAHWELTSEFDSMLSQLLAQHSMAAIEFRRKYLENPEGAGKPEETALGRVESLWRDIFTGRELLWRDWKPVIRSTVGGNPIEYSGNQMSDGEKAALFLAGRVFSSEAGVLVVDEPETHFHSLLAVRLWNALEDARTDIRFVYITHDLTFALSRRNPQFVLASPTDGLRPVDVGDDLPTDVAEALLGSASLSFYASRVVFCEGDEASIDGQLYNAWFDGPDTVVRPVGNCRMVIRCVDALRQSRIAQSLEPIGIIDNDYHAEDFLNDLLEGVHALKVHEVESLLCLPSVVSAVCAHTGQDFDLLDDYTKNLQATVNDQQRHNLVIERWKARVRPSLAGIVAQVGKESASLEGLVQNMPAIFNPDSWSFSPAKLLEEEKEAVEAVLPGGTAEQSLAVIPGKQLLKVAARTAGLEVKPYISLVVKALGSTEENLRALRDKLVSALEQYLPPRGQPVHAEQDGGIKADGEGH